jgi:ATP synthase protein I
MADTRDEVRKGLSLAFRIGTELVANLVVGLGLGYLADWYFQTLPTFIFVGVFLGIASGAYNFYRTISRFTP